jgi:hypothetical protein
MLSIGVDLGEDGPKATGLLVISNAGINDQGIWAVLARVVHNGF